MTPRKIVILGAGRSIKGLIDYLEKSPINHQFNIILVDRSLDLLNKWQSKLKNITTLQANISDSSELNTLLEHCFAVVSMLPPDFHYSIAKKCSETGINFFSASYISNDIKLLSSQFKEKNAICLMECGLDPGIDHMSSQETIDKIKEKGGKLTSFKSYTGGLISPESDDNPWHYKFTWNPKNVVLAGQGVIKYRENGINKNVPYYNLYSHTELLEIDGLGFFDVYPNRDSLKYKDIYQLEAVPTIVRGTLRKQGFCEAWNILVQLGMTDDSFELDIPENFTFRDFTNSFLGPFNFNSVENKVCLTFGASPNSPLFKRLQWLGIFDDNIIEKQTSTPAKILQSLLEEKWKLMPDDKDMVVMQHLVEYNLANKSYQETSTLVVYGENAENTSMAKTVGLPLAICLELFVNNEIELNGVVLPTSPVIYKKILPKLEEYGIKFTRSTQEVKNRN